MAKFLIVNRFFGGSQIPTGRMAEDVAKRLAEQGHKVTALTSRGTYGGVAFGEERTTAAAVELLPVPGWMPRVLAWLWFTWRARRRIPSIDWDVCVLMTDPPLLPLLAKKLGGGGRKVAVWLMDLYPEALAAAGRLSPRNPVYREYFKRRQEALGRCDLLVCLGETQRRRLGEEVTGRVATVIIPPWDGRDSIGEATEASLQNLALYAGNLGEAHSFTEILDGAGYLPADWAIRFAVRGAKVAEMRAAVNALAGRGAGVVVTGYACRKETPQLLAAARVHLITMSPGWEGIVVPSKLYGCIRTGRPVLFVGPENSDTAREILDHNWGMVLPSGADGASVAAAILELAARHTLAVPPENTAERAATVVGRLAVGR